MKRINNYSTTLWDVVRLRLVDKTKKRGKISALSRHLEVSRQHLHKILKGKTLPRSTFAMNALRWLGENSEYREYIPSYSEFCKIITPCLPNTEAVRSMMHHGGLSLKQLRQYFMPYTNDKKRTPDANRMLRLWDWWVLERLTNDHRIFPNLYKRRSDLHIAFAIENDFKAQRSRVIHMRLVLARRMVNETTIVKIKSTPFPCHRRSKVVPKMDEPEIIDVSQYKRLLRAIENSKE